jgi:hypothetical protein
MVEEEARCLIERVKRVAKGIAKIAPPIAPIMAALVTDCSDNSNPSTPKRARISSPNT